MKMTEVPGLFLFRDIISEKDENTIFKIIEDCVWYDNRHKTRKIQICGPYHDRKWKIIPGKNTPHPKYSTILLNLIDSNRKKNNELKNIINNLEMDKFKNGYKCELFVNNYLPGSGLRQHHDHRTTYDEIIIGVSILSDSKMTFSRGKRKIKVNIPRRSMYILTGESRFLYKHGFQLGDITQRRISLTFRTVK